MAGKQPINLSFNFDTGEIRGKLGEINSLIQKVVAKGKNNELALKISGIEVLQDRLKQIDSSVQALAMRFANMKQSMDFSSEIDKNAKAIVRMDAQIERSMAALQDARKNRNKTADTFFGQVNTKKNISEIMDGADLEALSKSAGSNFSQIVEQIVLASSTVDGLNKQIQLTEEKSVSLQDIFSKIVSTISGTSIQDFFGDGNFSEERVQNFINEFNNKLSNMKLNFTPALQEAFKNMFASNVLNSQATVLSEEYAKAIENNKKAGQIRVNIDKESIDALAGAIGQLKAVIGEGEGKAISFGIKAEDIQPVTQAIDRLGNTITNIHNLLNQFDIPKIQTDGIDDVKNKLDEATQSAEKLKEEESKPSTGDGWNVDQIKQVIQLLGELKDGLNTIADANSQEAITQRFADMGTEISAVVLKLGELKAAFEGIDFNMTIKTNGNPIQQNADIAKQKRDAIDIYKQYASALYDDIALQNNKKLSNIIDDSGNNAYTKILDAIDFWGDRKPKSGSASALYDYYSDMVNQLKQLLSEAGIDISSITSQFEPQLSEVNNKIRSIGDTGQQVERTLRNVFGGNLNVDNALNVDTINQSMLELKSVLEQIQQILSVGLGINLDEQGPVYTYFDKILQKIQEINEAVKLFSDTINSLAPQIPNGGGSSGNKKRTLIPAIGNGKLSRIDIRGDKDDNELGRTETYVSNTQGANVTRKINFDNGQTAGVNTAIDYKKALEEATTALKNYERAVEELVKAKSALDNPDGTKSQNALTQGLKEAQEAADLTKQKLDDLKSTFEKNPLLQASERNAFKERIDKATNVYTDPTIGETYQKNKGRIIGKLQKQIEDFQEQYDNFVNNANGKFFGDTYDQSVKNMQAQMQQLLSLGINIEKIDLIGTDDISRAKELLDTMKQTISAANKDASMLEASSTARSSLAKSIGVYLGKNTKLSEGRRAGLESLFGELQGDVTVQRLDEIKNKFNEISAAAAMAGETGRSFGDQLATSFSRLSRYILSFASFYRIIGIFKQAVSIVKELDSALMEVRKVSSESASSLERWQKSTFNQANEVGGNAKQIQESTATWLRLGKSFKESQEAAQASVKLLNVSEFENIDDATTSLVSMRQAFKDLSYEDFIDKLNGVGDNFSSSTDQLAYGMRNVSSVLKVAGNDIDQSLALLTAANDITQDMSKASMGVRTVALRISGTEQAKQELEDMGEDVSDFVVQTQSKVDAQVRNYTKTAENPNGISVLDDNGRLRSTYDILLDISKVYGEIVEKDNEFGTNTSNALLELLAGKTRSNILASILQNPDVLQESYEQSKNSKGIGQRELDIYLDSVEAKLTKLQNRLQELAAVTIDSSWLKGLIDFGSQAIQVITSLTKTFGGFNLAVGAFLSYTMQKSGRGFLNYDKQNGFTSILNGTALGKRKDKSLSHLSMRERIFGQVSPEREKAMSGTAVTPPVVVKPEAQVDKQAVGDSITQSTVQAVQESDIADKLDEEIALTFSDSSIGDSFSSGITDAIYDSDIADKLDNEISGIFSDVDTSGAVINTDQLSESMEQAGNAADQLANSSDGAAESMNNISQNARTSGAAVNEMAQEIQQGASAMSMLKTIGATFVSTIVNMAIVMAAQFAVKQVINWIWEWINATQIAIDKGKEAKNAIDDVYSSFDNSKQSLKNIDKSIFGDDIDRGTEETIDALSKRYEELKNSVSQFTNENLSLTSEDYDEYLSICNQLAEQFPSLVRGYDDQGNAILRLGNSADTAKASLSELLSLQQMTANVEIGKGLQDVYEGVIAQNQAYTEESAAAKENAEYLEKVANSTKITYGTKMLTTNYANADKVIREMWDKFGLSYIDTGDLTAQVDENGNVNLLFEGLQDRSREAVAEIEEYFDGIGLSLSPDIDLNLQKQQINKMRIEDQWAILADSIGKYLSTSKSFNELQGKLQDAILGNIANIDTSKIADKYGGDVMNFIYGEFIQPLSSLNEKQQIDVSDLFMIDISETTVSDYHDKIMSALQGIFKNDGEAESYYDTFGFGNIEDAYQKIQQQIWDSFYSRRISVSGEDRMAMLGLNGNELDIAAKLMKEKVYDTWDDLYKAIQEKTKEDSKTKKEGILSDVFGNAEYQDKAESYEKALSSLSSALQDLQNNGKLTAETMRDLQEQFPNLTDFSKKGIQEAAQKELSGWIKEVSKSWEDFTPQGIKQLNTYVQNLTNSYGELGISADIAKEAVKNSIVTTTGTDITSLGERKRQLDQYEQAIDNLKNYYGEENINWEVVWMLALEDRFSDPAANIYEEYNNAVVKWEIQVEYEQTKKDIEKNLQNIQAQRALVESKGSRRNTAGLSEDNYDELLALDDQAIEEYTNAVENTYEARMQAATDTLEQAEKDYENAYANHDSKGTSDASKIIAKSKAEIEWLEQNKEDIDKENIEAQTNLENSVTQKFQDELSKAQSPLKGLSRELGKLQDDATKTQDTITELENQGLRGTKDQYQNLIDNADLQIGVLDRQKAEWETLMSNKEDIYASYGYDYKSSDQYITDLQEISNIEAQIIELRSNKDEWALQPLTNELTDYQNAYTKLQTSATKTQDEITTAETNHLKVSDKLYQNLIDNGDKQISNMKDQQRTLRKLQSEVDNGSDKWRDYQSQIDSLDSSIAAMQNDQAGWFEAMTSSVSANAESLSSAISSAFSEINSDTGLTIDTMNELQRQFSDLSGTDVSSLFYESADGMKLNVAAAESLIDAEYQLQQANLQEIISTNEKIAADQNATASAREQAEARIEAAQRELSMLQALYDQQKEQFSRLSKFEQAKQSENGGANFETMQGYLKTQNENRTKGLTGTDEFKAYTEYFDRWGLNTIQAWDRNKEKVERYLTEDVSGVANFMDDVVAAGFGKKEDGNYFIDYSSLEDLADALDMSQEWVRDMFGRAEDYGLQHDWIESELDGHEKIKEAIHNQMVEQEKYNQMLAEGASQQELDEQAQEVQYYTNKIDNLNQKLGTLEDHTGEISSDQIRSAINSIQSIGEKYAEAKQNGVSDDDLQEYIDQAQTIADQNYLKFKGEVTDFEIDTDKLKSDFPDLDVKVNPVLPNGIDLLNRPQVSAETMWAAGYTKENDYDIPAGDIATVFSHTYTNNEEHPELATKAVVVTPILPNGEVLSPSELEGYAQKILAGEEIDKPIELKMFEGENVLEQADAYGEVLHQMQAMYDTEKGWDDDISGFIDTISNYNGEQLDSIIFGDKEYQNPELENALDGILDKFDLGQESGQALVETIKQMLSLSDETTSRYYEVPEQENKMTTDEAVAKLQSTNLGSTIFGKISEAYENYKYDQKVSDFQPVVDGQNTINDTVSSGFGEVVSGLGEISGSLNGTNTTPEVDTPQYIQPIESYGTLGVGKASLMPAQNQVVETSQTSSTTQEVVAHVTQEPDPLEINTHTDPIQVQQDGVMDVNAKVNGTAGDFSSVETELQSRADELDLKAKVDGEAGSMGDTEQTLQSDVDAFDLKAEVDGKAGSMGDTSTTLQGMVDIMNIAAEVDGKAGNVNGVAQSLQGMADIMNITAEVDGKAGSVGDTATTLQGMADVMEITAEVDGKAGDVTGALSEMQTEADSNPIQVPMVGYYAEGAETPEIEASQIDVTADNSKVIAAAQEAADAASSMKGETSIDADTSGYDAKSSEVKQDLQVLDGTTVSPSVNVDGNAQSTLSSIDSQLNSLNGKEVVTRVVTEHVDRNGSGLGGINNGVALAGGTKDKLPTTYNNGVLVGEEAPEMHVSRDGGYWELVGQNGPEFRNDIAPGDIVFNAQQTKKLLKNGHTNSRGKALAGGTQTLHGFAFKGGLTGQERGYATLQLNHTGDQLKATADALGDVASSAKAAAGAQDAETEATENTVSALDRFNAWLSSLFDWIEVRIERITHRMELAISKAENLMGEGGVYTTKSGKKLVGYQGKNAYIEEAMNENRKLQNTNTRAVPIYERQAVKVAKRARKAGLITKKQRRNLVRKIKNGAMSIQEFDAELKKNKKGEETSKSESTRKTFVDAYKQWYDKARECEAAIQDCIAKTKELEQTKLDNIVDEFESLANYADSVGKTSAALLSLNNTVGHISYSSQNKNLYQDQINANRNMAGYYKQEMDDYNLEMQNAAKIFGVNSNEYREAQIKFQEMNQSLYEAQENAAKLTIELRKLDLKPIEYAMGRFEEFGKKLSGIVSLKEARGILSGQESTTKIDESDYYDQIKNNNSTIVELMEKIKIQQGWLEQGFYDQNGETVHFNPESDAYRELESQIAADNEQINQLLISNENLKKSIVTLRWEAFEDLQKKLNNATSDYEHLQGLINQEGLFDDNGKGWNLTDEGVANLTLIAAKMYTAEEQIKSYREALNRVQEEYENGNRSLQDYEETSRNHVETIQKLVDGNQNLKKSIIDTYKTQITNENNALVDLINKRKEAYDAKKKYYDYDKQLRQQNDDISKLRAQAAALQGVSNQASQARLARINDELAQKEKDMADSVAQHRYEVGSEGYSKLADSAQESLSNTLAMVASSSTQQEIIVQQMLANVSAQYESAYDLIQQKIDETGTIISNTAEKQMQVNGKVNNYLDQMVAKSDQLKTAWDNYVKLVTPSGQTMSEALTGFITLIDSGTRHPKENWEAFVEAVGGTISTEAFETFCKTISQGIATETEQWNAFKSAISGEIPISGTVIDKALDTVQQKINNINKTWGEVINKTTGESKEGVDNALTAGVAVQAGQNIDTNTIPMNITSNNKTVEQEAAERENARKAAEKAAQESKQRQAAKADAKAKADAAYATYSGYASPIDTLEKEVNQNKIYWDKWVGVMNNAKHGSEKWTDAAKKAKHHRQAYEKGNQQLETLRADQAAWLAEYHRLQAVYDSLPSYKVGTKRTLEDELALTHNKEIILSNGAVLRQLPKGSQVLPKDQAENIWKWSKIDPFKDLCDSLNSKGNINSVNSTGNNFYYDSLIHIDGNVDADVMDRLEDFGRALINNRNFQKNLTNVVTKEFVREGRKLGYK